MRLKYNDNEVENTLKIIFKDIDNEVEKNIENEVKKH